MGFPGQTIPFTSPTFPRGSVDVSLGAGFLRACGAPYGDGDFQRLALCIEPLGGAIHGAGHGFRPDRSSTRPWFAAAASAVYQRRILGPLTWGLRAQIAAPLLRQSFTVETAGIAFTPAPIGGALDIEVRVSIW